MTRQKKKQLDIKVNKLKWILKSYLDNKTLLNEKKNYEIDCEMGAKSR